jgi:hypothetical protein
MVAVWDIATESPLLSKRVGKSCILYPYHSFHAHIGVVSGMTDVRVLESQHTSCLKRNTTVVGPCTCIVLLALARNWNVLAPIKGVINPLAPNVYCNWGTEGFWENQIPTKVISQEHAT